MIEQIRTMNPGVEKTLSTSASVIAGPHNDRWEAIVQNKDAAISVTLSTGVVLGPGQVYRHMGRGALSATAASGTPKVVVIEVVGPGNVNRRERSATVALSTAAKVVLAKDRARRHATVENLDAAIAVTVGGKGVTAATGITLAAGQSIDLYGGAEVWAVAASGTPNVKVVEEGSR